MVFSLSLMGSSPCLAGPQAALGRCCRRGGAGRLACQIGDTMSSPASSDVEDVASNRASPRKHEALELFRGLPQRYDALSAALSFWQDPRWRRALVSAVAPQTGQRVLDVATGTGMVAAELLRRADCTVVGIDQSAEMLAGARQRFATVGRERVELIEGQAEALPFGDQSFDALTFTYLLRYVDDPRATSASLLGLCVQAGGWHRWSSACRHGLWQGQPGDCTRRLACLRWVGWLRPSGRTWVAFSVRVSVASTSATRSSR